MQTFNHSSTKAVIVTTSRGREVSQTEHVGVNGFRFDSGDNLVILDGDRVVALYASMRWDSVVVRDVTP